MSVLAKLFVMDGHTIQNLPIFMLCHFKWVDIKYMGSVPRVIWCWNCRILIKAVELITKELYIQVVLRYLIVAPIRQSSLIYFLGLTLICKKELLILWTTKLFLANRCQNIIIDFFYYAIALYHGFTSRILLPIKEHPTNEIHICRMFIKCEFQIWKEVSHEVDVEHVVVRIKDVI